jgi:hypothetical protein
MLVPKRTPNKVFLPFRYEMLGRVRVCTTPKIEVKTWGKMK